MKKIRKNSHTYVVEELEKPKAIVPIERPLTLFLFSDGKVAMADEELKLRSVGAFFEKEEEEEQ